MASAKSTYRLTIEAVPHLGVASKRFQFSPQNSGVFVVDKISSS